MVLAGYLNPLSISSILSGPYENEKTNCTGRNFSKRLTTISEARTKRRGANWQKPTGIILIANGNKKIPAKIWAGRLISRFAI